MATIDAIRNVLNYNTWLFNTAMDGVTDAQAAYRLNPHTNAFDRIAGHIVVCRYGMAGIAGIKAEEPPWGSFGEFGKGTQFKEELTCPALADIAAAYHEITAILGETLPKVTEETLSGPAPFTIPGDDQTTGGMLAFFAMHESYHVGQLALLRKSMDQIRIMG